jgi:hypothetical protein
MCCEKRFSRAPLCLPSLLVRSVTGKFSPGISVGAATAGLFE